MIIQTKVQYPNTGNFTPGKNRLKKVKYHTSDSKHLTVIPAFVWTISSEQQHQCTSMIIDKHREYLHTFQKGNEQAINTISIQFYFK